MRITCSILWVLATLRCAESFGSYLDPIQPQQPHHNHPQQQGERTSTAAKATATRVSPTPPITSSPSAEATRNLLDSYDLEPLDGGILKIPKSLQQHGNTPQIPASTTATNLGPASPSRSYLNDTGSTTSTSDRAVSSRGTMKQSPVAEAPSMGSAGDYLSAMSPSASTSRAQPKKSYGPNNGGQYKTVADTGFNGFLSGLSSSTPSSDSSATASVASDNPASRNARADYVSNTSKNENQKTRLSQSKNRSDTGVTDRLPNQVPNSPFEPKVPSRREGAGYSGSIRSQTTQKTQSNEMLRVKSKDIDKMFKKAASQSLSDSPQSPNVKAIESTPLPFQRENQLFPGTPMPELTNDDRIPSTLSSTTRTVSASKQHFLSPPLPLPLKEPKQDSTIKSVKYSQSPVGMFPAPPLPLPLEESASESTGEVQQRSSTRSAEYPSSQKFLDRPIQTTSVAGTWKDRPQQQSSYRSIGRGTELSGSSGMKYIPRSEIFGAQRSDGPRRVIASSGDANMDVVISTQGDISSKGSATKSRARRRFEDRFNALIQGNTERAQRAKEAGLRRAQAVQTLADTVKQRKKTQKLLGRGDRAHKAPAAVIADLTEAAPVQGGSLKTWSFRNHALERIHVALKTGGRPLNAELNLWRGPDDVPFKMRVYCENGFERPFSAVIETPHGPNTVSVRNAGQLEFPLAAHVIGEEDDNLPTTLPSRESAVFEAKPMTVHGGALKTFIFDASVESVQVLLRTDGLPINATIELLQGPTNSKQSVHVYSEEGSSRPLFMVIETPGNGNVVRVANAAPIEFPLIASVEPYSIGQALSPTEPVISGDVIHDEKDPDETSPGFVRRLYNYGRNKWYGRS